MAAVIGAASGGARAFTASSSHGLAYMHELLHWASAARLPIVMAEVNRAL
jgi:pyruvate/2-oxoacid:ferredoxin oxidoreductase alpha subunit